MATDEKNFYEEAEEVEAVEAEKGKSTTPEENNDEVETSDRFEDTPTLDLSGVDLGDFEVDDSDDEGNDILSPEERLRLFSDEILSSCIQGKALSKYALDKLTSIANPRLFRDENYILFSIYYFYRSKLKLINIDAEFIKLFLTRNRGLLKRSRGYIDINAYGEVEGSNELGYIAGVIKHFNRLKTLPDISISDFETYFEKYLIEFKAIEAAKVYRKAQQILTEGVKIGRKTRRRPRNFSEDCREQLRKTRKRRFTPNPLMESQNSMGTGFIKMSEVLMDEKPDNKKPIKIGDFGRITQLNEAYGGIYTGMFYSFIAPPKAGKTKLCARLCHNVAVVSGNNVTVWAQEGGHEMWSAQMRAIHFDYVYNTGADIVNKKFGVTQEVIMHDSFKSRELRELELSSKLDLATNQDYGSVDYIDRPFNVETFIEDIDTSVKENNSKMVIIDYLQLIGSANGISERERIANAYKELLVYCKQNNIAAISPAQFKQESFNDLISRKSVDGSDLRTAAGGSSEVLRTPDILFALWASVTDLQNNSMKIISLPSRMNKSFPNIDMRVDLATCQFISIDS